MADDAREIYQRHLDAMSAAVWARDGAAIGALLDESVDVVTGDRSCRSIGRDATVATLVAFRDAMRGIGATSYHRICNRAARTAPDVIEGAHVTYVLRGGNYAIEPYTCEQTLRLQDGAWRMGRTRVERHHLGAASFSGSPLRLTEPGADAPGRDPERTTR